MPESYRPGGGLLRVVFGVIGLCALILGYIGLDELLRARTGTAPRWEDVIYFDLQLFVIGAEPLQEPGPYPWQLQAARFAAPLFTLLAVVEATRLLLAAEIRRFRARRARGHAVVCGDSQFAAMLADRLYRSGQRVVVVRSEPFGPLEFRRRRYLGVAGDPSSAEVLRGAGIRRARTVYACTEDGDRNHAIATAASRLVVGLRRPPRVYVQVHDADACLSLQARRLGAAGSSALRLDYFHVDDVAARALYRHHPLRPVPDRPTRVLIAGTAPFRRAVLVETARHWRELREVAGAGTLIVDVVAPDASTEVSFATGRFPFIRTACELTAHDARLGEIIDADRLGAGYDRIYLCAQDERVGLHAALNTPALWRGAAGSVFVPLHRQAALAEAFHGEPGHDLLDEVHGKLRLYPVLTRACDAELIAEDLTERLARLIHDAYLRAAAAAAAAGVATGATTAGHVPWSGLSPTLRWANRAQVQHIAEKLLELDCVVAPRQPRQPRQPNATATEPEPEAIDPQRLDRLAEMEHDRWCAERRQRRWQYGEVRDDARRRHPDLVPWERLSEPSRAKARDAVRQLPVVLADVGFEIVRLKPLEVGRE